MNNNRSPGQKVNNTRRFYGHKKIFFNEQCFTCHNFRNKVAQCVAYKTIMTRKERKQRNEIGVKKNTYNNFSPLIDEIDAHFAITLDMKNLNVGENYSQHLQKRKYQQILRYGKGRSYILIGKYQQMAHAIV